MAQRRSRRSSGMPADPSPEEQLALFDDFRKRHHRQNKDIIQENITRRKLIHGLQDQVAALQAEVLELRRANAALSRRVGAGGGAGVWDETSRHALDLVLAAVPALERLRGAFDADATLGNRREEGQRETLSAVLAANRATFVAGNPTATRPAASAKHVRSLPVLCETDETGTPRRRAPRAAARRSSPSTATPPSISTATSEYLPSAPGSPFASPSPKRTATTPRRRRRRESGLFAIGTSAAVGSPDVPAQTRMEALAIGSPCAASDAFADADEDIDHHTAPTTAWHIPTPQTETLDEDTVEAAVTPTARGGGRRRGQFPAVRVKDVAKQLDAAVEAAAVEAARLEQQRRTPDRSPVQQFGSSPAPSSPLSSLPDDVEDARTRPGSPTPTPTAGTSAPASEIETGTRARRARAAVSYKEPSLRKKMRKPDGMPAEEALGLRPRHMTTLDTAAVGVRRKSALPRSAGKPDLGGASVSDDDDGGDDVGRLHGQGQHAQRRPPTPVTDENVRPDDAQPRASAGAKPSPTPAPAPAPVMAPLQQVSHNTPAASSRKRGGAPAATQRRRPVPPPL